MSTLSRSQALKQLLIFSLPLIFGQVGLMLIGTGDMIIAGRYSRECLAAIGLAIAILNPIQISLLGLQFSIAPLLARKRGEGEDIKDYYWTVTIYGLLVAIASALLSLLSYYLVPILDYGPELNSIIQEYILITSGSTLGLNLYQSCKEFLQAQEKNLAANAVALIAAGFNLGLNFILVFGYGKIPSLGEAGLAWASLICRLLMALGLMLVTKKFWNSSRKINWSFMRDCWQVGVPISATLFFEIMAFCSVTLFVGRLTQEQVAANNLALNIGSLAFMLPLSVSSAVAVKVGHALGEKNLAVIRVFSRMGMLLSFGFTSLMGLSFYLFPALIIGFYTTDPGVLLWGQKLLFCIACFQVFDGAQVTLSGILRGLGVTKPSSIAIFVGYWLIGIPLGYVLGFHTSWEAQGFWIGLALSLAVVAASLLVVMSQQMKILEKRL
jgi:MATE family multidrug resistance protein